MRKVNVPMAAVGVTATLVGLFALWPAFSFAVDQWRWSQHVAERTALFFKQSLRPNETAKTYQSSGPYYGYGETRRYIAGTESGRIKVDDQGFPQVKYANEHHYNPVTIAQQALAEYSRATGPSDMFLPAVDRLLEMQDENGAFRYEFEFTKYATGEVYEPGWVSGMAQGQALSAIARAYYTTADTRYLDAGKKALDFMLTPYALGGTYGTLGELSAAGGIRFEEAGMPFIYEYPQTPSVYTLNGFMFSLQGLHDWAELTKSETALVAFDVMLETLIRILPLYDQGTITSYDLAFLTIPKAIDGSKRMPHIAPAYHAVHIEQLWALYAVTGNDVVGQFADRWQGYID